MDAALLSCGGRQVRNKMQATHFKRLLRLCFNVVISVVLFGHRIS